MKTESCVIFFRTIPSRIELARRHFSEKTDQISHGKGSSLVPTARSLGRPKETTAALRRERRRHVLLCAPPPAPPPSRIQTAHTSGQNILPWFKKRERLPTMETLPPEVLSIIMLYLPLEDRLSCSLTCRRWAEVLSTSQLLDDVWLDIAGHEIEAATSVLVNSQRAYTKLLLHKVDLSKIDFERWEKIGATLRELELEECSWSAHLFYAILKRCTKLESLKLVDGENDGISIRDFVLPEGTCHEELRDSLSHLRHLHLHIELTADILDVLLALMSNVTSLFLSARFEDDPDFLERLPSILKRNRIRRIGAVFYRMGEIGSEKVIKFVEITSESLEELQIYGDYLTEIPCDEIISCTRLRHLALYELSTSFSKSHLRKLVSNSPGLEVLEIEYNDALEDEDMLHLFELKGLRALTLKVSRSCGLTTEFLCGLREISSLVSIELRGITADSRGMRNLVYLTNLRALVLDECVDSECFEAICKNLDKLTKLHLGDVQNLTDSDGSKLCHFKELRSLSFRDGYGFTDLTFERGVGSRAMKSLFIEGCSLTDAGLVNIASHHDRLEQLTIFDCNNITDAGVAAMLQSESRLKDLSVASCESVRCEWRTRVRNICPRLRTR